MGENEERAEIVLVEQKLKESEEKFRTIAEQAIMGVAIAQDNKFKYINKVYADIFGYSREEMKAWDFNDAVNSVYPEDREYVAGQCIKKQKGEKDINVQYLYRGIKKSGDIIWVKNFSKSINYLGRTANFITLVDVTKEQEAEKIIKVEKKKLIKSERKYRQAYHLAEFYKDLFAHDVSNLLQNVLSSIELSSFYLSSNEGVDKLKNLFNGIKEQVKRGANLISNVRKLSKLDKSDVLLEKISLNECLKQSIKNLKTFFPNREKDIKIETVNEVYQVKASELLVDAFKSVLINAVNHNNNENIEIEIKVSKQKKKDDEYVKIEFIDNGIGVVDSRKIEIFERESKLRNSIKGIGLGLSLVKRIVKNHNGKVWVEDKVQGDFSKGSNFIILIPSIFEMS